MAKNFKSKMQEQFSSIESLNADTSYESKSKNVELRPVATLTELPENDLIPPLKEDDYKNLYVSIKKDMRIRTPLHISKDNTVLCGNNRLKIARQLGITEVPVLVIDIPKEQHLFYAIEDNLFRRQLNDAQKAELILQLKPDIKKQNIEKRQQNLKRGTKSPEGVGSNTFGKSAEVLAKKAGISRDTLKKSEKIKKENPDLFHEVKAGEVSVHKAYNQVKKSKPKTIAKGTVDDRPWYLDHGVLTVQAFKYNFNRPNKAKRNRLIGMCEEILGMLRHEKQRREKL